MKKGQVTLATSCALTDGLSVNNINMRVETAKLREKKGHVDKEIESGTTLC